MKSFTDGPIARQLGAFSLPIVVTSLLQVSIQLINGLWVGNLLGSEAFGAVTVGTVLMMVVLAFVMGVNQATLTVFAQLRGRGDSGAIGAYLSAFVIILCLLSALISVAGYVFAEPLLVLLNTPAAIIDEARIYLQITFAGTLLLVGYNFISTVLRAFGDSRTPLYFVLLATGLITLLSPLFIGVFGWGMAGAALAVVAAQGGAFLYSLVHLARKFPGHGFRLRWPQWVEAQTILRLGIPSGAQMVVIHAGTTVILSLVNSLGAHAVAGFGAAQRLDNLILLPAVAVGTAITAMAGQNIGAQQWLRVGRITRAGIAYNTGIMLLLASILFIWAEPLISLFIQDEASVAFGTSYLKTIAFFYPFIGLNFVFNSVVRGAGAMVQVLALNIISLWVLRVPLAYWATSVYGDTGVALGIGLSFMLSAGFSFAYYRWGRWRAKRLFQ
ncbi:putative transporter-like membrane protein [Pseudomonas saudimassiliensis]|uniref:Putative transporter-like membrane protein n=1 Tax=Pseudomonas saudimassiliensis TaxID=1461581 RepID=A0A078M676_9PSED|nr:MATE family efflux transporter [Pseudomonas saudimassiliensis]CEA00887.1 putative transporter-like membrane protein [Pseudomonas saudimassiliensis]CEF25311.1 putative transporter-like membrane protein [Pseudomonas saudimassiliensis]